jgi:hypothetical protein
MNTRAKTTGSAIPSVKAEPLTQPRKGAKPPKLCRDHCEMFETAYAALPKSKRRAGTRASR